MKSFVRQYIFATLLYPIVPHDTEILLTQPLKNFKTQNEDDFLGLFQFIIRDSRLAMVHLSIPIDRAKGFTRGTLFVNLNICPIEAKASLGYSATNRLPATYISVCQRVWVWCHEGHCRGRLGGGREARRGHYL